jgi:hypothetical protein
MAIVPMKGDRSASDTVNYPELHATDIENGEPTVHVPHPVEGAFLYSADGVSWTIITLSELCLILGITPPGS